MPVLHGDVITQANGSAFEAFDADPCADQAIEHVFYRLQRRQGCHLGGLGDECRDVADLALKAGFDRVELIEQSCDLSSIGLSGSLCRARGSPA